MKIKIDSASFFDAISEDSQSSALVRAITNDVNEGEEWKSRDLINVSNSIRFYVESNNFALPIPFDEGRLKMSRVKDNISVNLYLGYPSDFLEFFKINKELKKIYGDSYIPLNNYFSGYLMSKSNTPLLVIKPYEILRGLEISLGDSGTNTYIFDKNDYLNFDAKLGALENFTNNVLQVSFEQAKEKGKIESIPQELVLPIVYNGNKYPFKG